MIAGFTIGIVAFSIYWFFLRWRNKISVHLLDADYRSYKDLRIKRSTADFTFNEGNYDVDLKMAVKNKRGIPNLYYPWKSSKPAGIGGIPEKTITPQDQQMLLKARALKEILNREASKKLFLVMIIAIIAVAGVAGISMFLVTQSNNNLQNLFRQYLNATQGGTIH
jgi:hypothetical protein